MTRLTPRAFAVLGGLALVSGLAVWRTTRETAIDCTQVVGHLGMETAIAALAPGGTLTCAVGDFEWADAFNSAGKDGITIAGTKTTVLADPPPTPTRFRLARCDGGLRAGHRLSIRVPHPMPGGSVGVDVAPIAGLDPETCDVALETPLSGIPLTEESGNVTGLTRIRYATATKGATSPFFPNSHRITLTGFAFTKETTVAAFVMTLLPEQLDHEIYENDFDNPTPYATDAVLCNVSNTAGRCQSLVHHNTSSNVILHQVRAANSNHALTATLWGEEAPWGDEDQAYIEDNTIYGPPQGYAGADCDFSGRATVRFNRFVRAWVETHGTRGTPPGLGCRAHDVHYNLFVKGSSNLTSPFFLRGGSAFTWRNSIDAAFQYDYEMNFDRNSVCGVPTGSPPTLLPYDENRGTPYPSDATVYGPGHGWHCLGQIGLGALKGYDVATDAWSALTSYTLEPANLSLNRTCASPPCVSTDPIAQGLLYNFQRGLSPCVEFQLEIPYADFLAQQGQCGTTKATKAQLLAVKPVSAAYVYVFVTDEHEWNACSPGPDGQWYRGKAGEAWTVINAPLQYPHPKASLSLCTASAVVPPDVCGCGAWISASSMVSLLMLAWLVALHRRGRP